MKRHSIFTLIIIVLLGLLVRLYGLNWDQGQHLHPDERFLTMVVDKIQLPSSLSEYLDTSSSPLNPHNNGFRFYVYGDLPLLITSYTAHLFQMTTYDSVYIVGRVLSAVFDTGTIVVIFFLSLLLFSNKRTAFFSAIIYCFSVLPIQQSHFFTSDSFLVFFSTTSLLFFIKYLKEKKMSILILTGVSFGLTLSCKTSIIITTPLFYAAILYANRRNPYIFLKSILLFSFMVLGAFRIFQPYAFVGLFTLSPTFVSNLQDAHRMITGEINYPPNVQWTGTLPLLHPLIQIFRWGLGPVATVLVFIGAVMVFQTRKLRESVFIIFVSLFALIIFIYQGVQLAKYMRYFYPIYPILAIFAGLAISKINIPKKIRITLFLLLMFWPLCFLSIYQKNHSRVQASDWIYKNIPIGSTVTSEEWDDSLPLNIGTMSNQNYKTLSLPMFIEDSRAKWQFISNQIEQADYIILSSNRVYGSVSSRPTVYPTTIRYYELLFDGKLGFKIEKTFSSYPGVGSVTINDSSSEESFTVYDHPQIYIFRKTSKFSQDDIMKLLFKNEKTS